MRKMFIAGVIGLTVSVFAADKVWNGSAGDRKWSTPANWVGGSAPVSDDSVQITLASAITVTNDISGLSLSGLVISNTAAAGLAGQTISLAGNASIVAGANLTLAVPFGGSGTITRSGAGYLYLTGNSSTFAGAWFFTNGHTYVQHVLALGPTAPVTLYGTTNDTCSLRMDAAGTYANPMTFYKGSSQVYYSYKTLTNTAPIVCYGGQVRLMASSGSMYIQGGLTSMDNTGVIFNSAGGNKIVLENTPPNLGTAQFYFDSGAVDLGVSGTWGSMLVAKGTLRTLAEDVLGTNGAVRLGIGYGLWGTLDMNGFNQKVNGIYGDTGADASNPRRITSATPALLESVATDTRTFNGMVDGAVSFRMSGTGRQNFDKGISTTRGEMVCARGLLGLSPEAQFTALSALVITNTGYMVVTSPRVNPGLVRVRIADTGILDIGTGIQIEAFDAQVNGVYLAPGVYTKNNLSPRLTGNGSLNVLTAGTVDPAGRFVWNGAGSDTSVRTAGNWIDGIAPAFNRTETLVFSDGTATASLAGEIDVYALNFRTNANFTLSAGDSAAKINLGAGGLAISNQATPFVSYEIVPAISLQAPQFWQMHTNTASLTLRGAITGGYSNWNWIVSGVSALHLYGDNSFVSPLIVSNGCLRIYSDTALGSPTRPVTVIGDSPKAYNHVFFEGPVRTNDVPLVLASYIGDICRSGQTLVLNGSLTALGGSGDSHIRTPGTVIARGGLDGRANRLWLQQLTGGTLVIENKPITCAANAVSQDDGGTVVLSATNNSWGTYYVYGGLLRCGASNVLTSTVSFGAPWRRNGRLDLNGFDQRVDALRSGTTADLTSNYCVTSPTPAVLTLAPATNTIAFSGYFAGEAGFHYAVPTGVFTFDAIPSTTKGALRVSKGTVGFAGGAGWLGSTNVIVSGTGTIRVQATSVGVAFGTAATGWNTHLILSESGKLQLDALPGETVKFLQIDGVEMPRGTYGATGSGARYIDDAHFSGSGVLTVRSQNIRGTILRLN